MKNDDRIFASGIDLTGRKIEYYIRNKAKWELKLDFYGVKTSINANSKKEYNQWAYFFKYFLSSNSNENSEFSVWFDIDDNNDSFIESIYKKDFKLKTIYILYKNRFILWAKFHYWSRVKTPIPPFNFQPLNKYLMILNASSVKPADLEGAILFIGPPYQGKSTLVNYFIRKGGSPLADNLTVIDTNKLVVLPYLTPSGIREETIKLNLGIQNAISKVPDDRITISEVTGKVYLLHFDEMYNFNIPNQTKIHLVVLLNNLFEEYGKSYQFEQISFENVKQLFIDFKVENGLDDTTILRTIKELALNKKAYILNYDLKSCNLQNIYNSIFELINSNKTS